MAKIVVEALESSHPGQVDLTFVGTRDPDVGFTISTVRLLHIVPNRYETMIFPKPHDYLSDETTLEQLMRVAPGLYRFNKTQIPSRNLSKINHRWAVRTALTLLQTCA